MHFSLRYCLLSIFLLVSSGGIWILIFCSCPFDTNITRYMYIRAYRIAQVSIDSSVGCHIRWHIHLLSFALSLIWFVWLRIHTASSANNSFENNKISIPFAIGSQRAIYCLWMDSRQGDYWWQSSSLLFSTIVAVARQQQHKTHTWAPINSW